MIKTIPIAVLAAIFSASVIAAPPAIPSSTAPAAEPAQPPMSAGEQALIDSLAYDPPVNLGETPLPEARDAVRRNPRSADAWHDLAESLDARGDLQGAVAAYAKAVKLPPRDIGRAYLYRDLAEARERAGDLKGAIAAARVSVKSWPLSRDGLTCADYEAKILVRLLVKARDLDAAMAFYRPLIEVDWSDEACAPVWDGLLTIRAE